MSRLNIDISYFHCFFFTHCMPSNCHVISSFVATSWLSPCCETCEINGWFTAIYSPCFGCVGCLKRHQWLL